MMTESLMLQIFIFLIEERKRHIFTLLRDKVRQDRSDMTRSAGDTHSFVAQGRFFRLEMP